jgi:sodium transport system permease protein
MRWNFIGQIVKKELISAFRDSRALRSFLMMPFILTPLFLIGFPLIFGQTIGRETVARQTVGVVGLDRLPSGLRSILEGKNGVDLIAVTDPVQAIQDGRVSAALRVPATGIPIVAGGPAATIEVIAKGTNQRAQVVQNKLERLIGAYSKGLAIQKLAQLNLPADTLDPVTVKAINADTETERAGGILAFIFPFLLFSAILGGAQVIAVDATAGEKERGTLEILLVSPISRLEVVLGKSLAVTLFALFSVMIQVLAFFVTGLIASLVLKTDGSGAELSQLFSGNLSLSPTLLLNLLLIGASVAAMLSGLMVAVCIYARSYKEAQTYLVPFTLISAFSSIGLQFADFITRSTVLYALPIIGTVVGILDLVKGKLTTELMLVIVVSNLAFAVITIWFALRNFKSEQVLFRN